MATILQQPVPPPVVPVMKKQGVRIKSFKSAEAFERFLLKFLKRNNVLHLATCRKNACRSTPLEYRLIGMSFYILSEGGGKFANLQANREVSFSIAEPYHPRLDFWSYRGVQGWGRATVYGMKENPRRFTELLKKMKIMDALKSLGIKELAPEFNYRIIEIIPDMIKYINPREGVFRVTWKRAGR
jgi:nitroimidazol reductase NimA-like FMN-containing flavoprotein (pyridoxamine 5'-phosphate oxidase superfamily)